MSTLLDNTAVGIGLSINDLVATSSTMAQPAAVVAATLKNKATPRAKKAPVVAKIEAAADGADGDEPTAPPPKTPTKRAPRKSKIAAAQTPTTGTDGEPTPAPASSAAKSIGKRPATQAPDGQIHTPTKKPKTAAIKSAASKTTTSKGSFPTCWEEFTPEDKLIVTMRHNKSAWPEIEAEFEKLTGNKPGKDVTRKKFAKLEAVATIFVPEDAAKIAAAKLIVEAAIDEIIKKAGADKWIKIAEQMKIMGITGKYKPAAIEKKYEQLVSQGLISSGVYVGPDEISASKGGSNGNSNSDSNDVDQAPEEDDIMLIGGEEEEA